VRDGTLVNVAVKPASVASVRTGTGPAAVSNSSRPAPRRSAIATAVAIVAWPQNATSACGLK
jgi:hypothetical protein